MRRRLCATAAALPFAAVGDGASNDQRTIWDRGMWLMPWHYCITLRRDTVRQVAANAAAY